MLVHARDRKVQLFVYGRKLSMSENIIRRAGFRSASSKLRDAKPESTPGENNGSISIRSPCMARKHACGASDDSCCASRDHDRRCRSDLRQSCRPSATVRIDSATLQVASQLAVSERAPTPAARIAPANPVFCKVLGHIDPTDPKAPPIKFEVNLPVEWNGRSVQYGGGGFDGTLITGLGLPPAYPFDKPSPLARGFVTYGTDSGHESKPGEPPQVFALNDEASKILPIGHTRRCAMSPSR
jgi:Tannase and feruloyl esterase